MRLRASGSAVPAGSKLAAVRDFAAAYDERPLSLYGGNCRVFCARVRREVSLPTPGRHTHSLTHPGGTGPAARSRGSTTLTSRGPRGKRRRPRQMRGSPCPCCTLARSPPYTRQPRSPFAGRAFWGAVAREGLGLAPTPVQRRGLKRRGPAPAPLRLEPRSTRSSIRYVDASYPS